MFLIKSALFALLLVLARMFSVPELFSPYFGVLFAVGFIAYSMELALVVMGIFLITDSLLGNWSGSWMVLSFTVGFFLIGSLSQTVAQTTYRGFLGITTFYLISNTYVWYGSTFYPQTVQGLALSIIAGWPFYQAQLMGLFAVMGGLHFTRVQNTKLVVSY